MDMQKSEQIRQRKISPNPLTSIGSIRHLVKDFQPDAELIKRIEKDKADIIADEQRRVKEKADKLEQDILSKMPERVRNDFPGECENKIVQRYLKEHPKTNLILSGKPNKSKTFLACWIPYTDRTTSFFVGTPIRLRREIWEKRCISTLLDCKWLILDDIDKLPAGTMGVMTKMELFEILQERHCIITTNGTKAETRELFGEIIFNRIVDKNHEGKERAWWVNL